MRIHQIASFQKHLKGSAPDHFAQIYLVLLPDEAERLLFLRKTAHFLLHYSPGKELLFLSKERMSPSEILQEIQQDSLFSSEKLIVYDGAEAFTKEQLGELEKGLKGSSDRVQMLLGSGTSPAALVKFVEKEGVIFDLLKEKPWDRKKRVSDALFFFLRSKGKKISPQNLEELIVRVGLDQALLENECEKLACFAAGREEITKADIETIGVKSLSFNSWQIAKALVWQEASEDLANYEIGDLSEWLKMAGALRYQIYIALKLHEAIREKKEVKIANISPKQLGYYRQKCAVLPEQYFTKMLISLYELEMKAKESFMRPEELWDLTKIAFFRAPLQKVGG